jgi:mono/diheme cytochrome c family protein
MYAKPLVFLLAGAFGLAGVALAQQSGAGKYDLGKYEYQAKCASCHGVSGKGDGPMRAALKKAPSDLTTFAKRNGGAFPSQLAWQVIDGRPVETGAHGTREMPVWGQDFRREFLRPEPGPSAEWYVAGRISAPVDYLESIQAK